MRQISINLLPPELQTSKEIEKRRVLFNKIGISSLIITLILTGGVIFLKVTQVVNVNSLQSEINSLKTSVNQLSKREGLVFFLQERINSINKTKNSESSQVISFRLIEKLVPNGILISNFSVDKSNNIKLTGTASSIGSLQQFFNNLTNKDLTEGRITNIQLTNLNQNSTNLSFELSLEQGGSDVIAN